MISRISLSVIALLWTALLPAPAQPARPDSVTVLVDAPPKTAVYLMVVDPLDNMAAAFLNKGTSRIEAGTFIRDGNWQSQALYLINGTDNLRFVRDETKQFWLLKSGNDQRDRELNFHVAWRKTAAPIKNADDFVKTELLAMKDPVQRETLARRQYETNLRFLADYVARHTLDAQFARQWQQIFYYNQLRVISLITPKNQTQALNQAVAKLITAFSDDSALYIPYYQQAAFQVATAIAMTNPNPTMLQRYEAIMSNFKGRTRDYLLTKLIGFGLSKEGFTPTKAEFAACLDRYNIDCQTDSYKAYIGKATSLQNVNVTDGNLLTTAGQSVPFSTISTNAPLTYVDFWASWCGPCREEMAASKALRAEYEAKGVRFVYISLDANPGAWERAANQIGLNAQTSYLLPGGNKSTLANRFKIATIPRYLLIGKAGRVVSANAPRPRTPAIRQLIQDSLK